MASTLIMAFALMLVMEGLMPFLAPRFWRNVFKRMVEEFTDGQIRFFGFASMIAGLLLLTFI